MTDKVTTQDDLTPKQLRGLVALLEYPTIQEAAKAAGVDARTLYRWMKRPEFRQALRDRVSQTLDRMYVRLASGSDDALKALHDLIKGKDTLQMVKRGAASDWLEHFTRLIEDRDLSERITELERRQNK